jgi:hypothetical protein
LEASGCLPTAQQHVLHKINGYSVKLATFAATLDGSMQATQQHILSCLAAAAALQPGPDANNAHYGPSQEP